MGVSSRGNAESVLAALVLGTLLCMEGTTGGLWSWSRHFFLCKSGRVKHFSSCNVDRQLLFETFFFSSSFVPAGHSMWAAVLYGLSVHMKIYPITYALPIALALRSPEGNAEEDKKRRLWKKLVVFVGRFLNRKLIVFASVSGGVFLILTTLFYYM